MCLFLSLFGCARGDKFNTIKTQEQYMLSLCGFEVLINLLIIIQLLKNVKDCYLMKLINILKMGGLKA